MPISAEDRIRELEDALATEKRSHQDTFEKGADWQRYAQHLQAKTGAGEPQDDPDAEPEPTPRQGARRAEPKGEQDLGKLVRQAVAEATKDLRAEVDIARRFATDAVRGHTADKMDRKLADLRTRFKDDFDDVPEDILEDHVRARIASRMRDHKATEPMDITAVLEETFGDAAKRRRERKDELAKVNRERAEAAEKKAAIPDLVTAAGFDKEWQPPETHEEADALVGKLLENMH